MRESEMSEQEFDAWVDWYVEAYEIS